MVSGMKYRSGSPRWAEGRVRVSAEARGSRRPWADPPWARHPCLHAGPRVPAVVMWGSPPSAAPGPGRYLGLLGCACGCPALGWHPPRRATRSSARPSCSRARWRPPRSSGPAAGSEAPQNCRRTCQTTRPKEALGCEATPPKANSSLQNV